MKWLIAPNAFKGTVEADEASEIIGKALTRADPDVIMELCPIADGGDGTCYLLGQQLGLEIVKVLALDPLGRPAKGFFGFDPVGKRAFMDVSTVSGIRLLGEYEKDPWTASTYGTGEMITAAIKKGAVEIVLGLGGSATIDMGTGILRALGYLFLDKNGHEVPAFSPGLISRAAFIQKPVQNLNIRFTCLCDVNNTFLGENGAIPVFGKQKGLKSSEHGDFEKASAELYSLLQAKSGQVLEDIPGFGAAGGIALGLSAFFPVKMEPGARYFFEQVKIEEKIRWSDWVITGEGRYDSQSAGGKGSYELLQLARKHNRKIILITSGPEGKEDGFDEVIRLKDLDFSARDVGEQARKNLFGQVQVFFENR